MPNADEWLADELSDLAGLQRQPRRRFQIADTVSPYVRCLPDDPDLKVTSGEDWDGVRKKYSKRCYKCAMAIVVKLCCRVPVFDGSTELVGYLTDFGLYLIGNLVHSYYYARSIDRTVPVSVSIGDKIVLEAEHIGGQLIRWVPAMVLRPNGKWEEIPY